MIYFILFILQITLFYKLIQISFPDAFILQTTLDEKLPFIKEFIIPYFLFVPILFLPFFMSFKNKEFFQKMSFIFLTVSVICNLFYLFFQTTIIRPEIVGTGLFEKLIFFIYKIDKPLNLFPSGHTTLTTLSTLYIFKINKKIGFIVLPVSIMIILSTFLIKQHCLADVFGGLLIAFFIYFLANRKNSSIR